MSAGKMVLALAESLQWNDSKMADALGIAKQSVAAYRRPFKPTSPRPQQIDHLSEFLEREEIAKASAIKRWIYGGRPSNPPIGKLNKNLVRETNVYYTGADDSESDFAVANLVDAVSDPRTIRARVLAVGGSGVWSAKGAQIQDIFMLAFLVSGRTPVKLLDQTKSIDLPKGTVLIFQPDDYAKPYIYLLWQSRSDPDLRTIRYIDSVGDPQALLSDDPSEKPLRLPDWSLIGFAYAMIQGAASGDPRIILWPGGIGPRRK